jgi:hypothetical protein
MNFLSLAFMAAFAFLSPNLSKAADIIGTWVYEVSDVPEEYTTGEITIMKEGDGYKADIKAAGGIMTLNPLSVDGNTISFKVMVEGSDVQVKMTFEGDIMTGKAESYDGVFLMKGKRK